MNRLLTTLFYLMKLLMLTKFSIAGHHLQLKKGNTSQYTATYFIAIATQHISTRLKS